MSDCTEVPKATAGGGWDERNLRADIVSVWGEHGAHAEVFDWMTSRIEELEAKTEALQAAALELLGECGNPWPSGHPLSDVVAEALANHEPSNPRGKWCCEQHREAFLRRVAQQIIADTLWTVLGKDSDHE